MFLVVRKMNGVEGKSLCVGGAEEGVSVSVSGYRLC